MAESFNDRRSVADEPQRTDGTPTPLPIIAAPTPPKQGKVAEWLEEVTGALTLLRSRPVVALLLFTVVLMVFKLEFIVGQVQEYAGIPALKKSVQALKEEKAELARERDNLRARLAPFDAKAADLFKDSASGERLTKLLTLFNQAADVSKQQQSRILELQAKLVELQGRMARRHLTEEQVQILIKSMKPYAGSSIKYAAIQDDPEVKDLVVQIAQALRVAGWVHTGPIEGILAMNPEKGVLVTVSKNSKRVAQAEALKSALEAAGLFTWVRKIPEHPPEVDTSWLELRVGHKPPY